MHQHVYYYLSKQIYMGLNCVTSNMITVIMSLLLNTVPDCMYSGHFEWYLQISICMACIKQMSLFQLEWSISWENKYFPNMTAIYLKLYGVLRDYFFTVEIAISQLIIYWLLPYCRGVSF